MTTAIENRIGNLWVAKQTGQGADPADADYKQGRWVAGDANPARDDGSENYLDGERFANAADFINSIVGNGNPTYQAQASFTGLLAYLMLGQEVVTEISPGSGIWEHVATPAVAGSFWTAFRKKVGETVGPLRQQFNDCRFASLRMEASSAAKVSKTTPSFISVGNPGMIFDTDPTAALDTVEPLLHTEAEGAYKIDAGDGTLATFRGLASYAMQVNDNFTPWYGDSVFPFSLVAGLGSIALEGITILVDEQGLELFNYIIYGSTNPPADTVPRTVLPPFGAFSADQSRGWHITQTGTPAGTWTLTVNGEVTANIAATATAAAVQTALEALPSIEPGDVTAAGGPAGTASVRIRFEKLRNPTITATGATISNDGPIHQQKVETPNVKWNPDLAIPANPDGGATELGLGAEVRRVSPDPFVRITTRSAEPAFT